MIGKLLKFLALLAIITLLIYGGMVIYGNFFMKTPSTTASPNLPKVEDAQYALYIENTGNIILTNDCEVFGSVEGSRSFALHGYWEQAGVNFRYNKGDIVLKESIFGIIQMTRRK